MVEQTTLGPHNPRPRYRSVLLRTSYRKDGKVLHETLGNLSDLPDDLIDVIKNRLAKSRLAECLDTSGDGPPKLTVTLPDESALDALSTSLARLLSVNQRT